MGVPLYTIFLIEGAHLSNSYIQFESVVKGTTIKNGPKFFLNYNLKKKLMR